ncbi:MAG TPA: PEP-CTERM sorting domain-containing protein [Telluria sp.]|nr:PEP-CTERM sorting domain-containing protein [Telluria sp.]
MSTRIRSLCALCAGIALMASPLSRADMVTTINISRVAFTTIDLAPDDGIAARTDVLTMRTNLTAYMRTADEYWSDTRTPAPFSPASAHIGAVQSSVTAAVDGTAGNGSLLIDLSGAGDGIEASARSEQVVTLVVTPYSRLSISGHMLMSGIWADPNVIPYQTDTIFHTYLTPDLPGAGSIRQLRVHGDEFPSSSQQEADYLLTWENNTAEYLTLEWRTVNQVISRVGPSLPIPEPNVLPMLLAGLFVFGTLNIRRSRQGSEGGLALGTARACGGRRRPR